MRAAYCVARDQLNRITSKGRTHLLQLLGVGDDLDDPVPDLLADVVSRRAHQRQHRVDIPLVVGREFLGKNGDFEDHLLAKRVVGDSEVLEQLAYDGLGVGRVAHRVQQVETAPSDRDVLVAQRLRDCCLVLLDRLEVVASCCEVGHRIETEVADVRLLRGDESTEQVRCLLDHDRLGVEVDCEIDCFEQNGVLRVVLLDVAVLLARVLEDALEDVVKDEAESRVLCVQTSERWVLSSIMSLTHQRAGSTAATGEA